MVSSAPISVLDHGAVSNGLAAVNTAAFSAALVAAIAAQRPLYIPAGSYPLTAGVLNFAAQGLKIFGDGLLTELRFEGNSSAAFNLDGGTNGSGVGEMIVEDLLIYGNASISYGFYQSGVWRSTFKNITVRDCTTQAFYILHGVSNNYTDLKYSVNANAPVPVATPTRGIVLGSSGPGYYTADCTFINTIMEGHTAGPGIYIIEGSGNTFVGGTSEGNSSGVVLLPGCARNTFKGMWFEANTSTDVEVNGTSNNFYDCYFGSSSSNANIECVVSGGALFVGGYVRSINLQATSSDTTLIGCGVDENLGGAIGIKGVGTYKSMGLSKIGNTGLVTGNLPDVLGESGSFIATARGLTTVVTGTIYYSRVGKSVTLSIPTILGVSNSTEFDLNVLPPEIRPVSPQYVTAVVINNGVYSVSEAEVLPNGYLVFIAAFISGPFVASGTKGVSRSSITYSLT